MSTLGTTFSAVEDRPRGLWSPGQVRLEYSLTPSSYFRWKGAIEWPLAAVLLCVALPIIGILVLLVRITSRGPGIYRQRRVGKDGRPFLMYKIRTMRGNAEAGSGAVWATSNDPRVTLVGRLLRASHLDELPQLYNVLKGEMALMGPRPERPEFVHVLAKIVPNYVDRLAVLPGISGLAQVNFPPDTDLNSVRRKLIVDREYILKAGWLLDARLFLCTLGRAFGIRVAVPLRLHREVVLPDLPVVSEMPSRGSTDFPANSTVCPLGYRHCQCSAVAAVCGRLDYGTAT